MYAVFILEEAHEDLIKIVAHLSLENPAAAEKLGNQLVDLAQSLESDAVPRIISKKAVWSPQADPWELPDLLPD
jgi:hypothetical protein